MQKQKREHLKNLYDAGITSAKELKRITRIPKSTIYENLKKFDKGKGIERKAGSGKISILQKHDKCRIVSITKMKPKMSAERIAIRAYELGSPQVSARTIQRYLKSICWRKLIPLKKPFLTQKMKDQRVSWCKNHLNTDWERVIFSDESKFQMYRITQKQWGKKRDTIPVPKHPPSLMIWEAISLNGEKKLEIVSGTIDSDKYISILDKNLLWMTNHYYPNELLFQQDNAPCHISKKTMGWLQSKNIRVLGWPPGSPDLNPIENLWAIIKHKVELENPKNVSDLKEKISKIWNEIPYEILGSLIRSVPEGLQKCIEVNGETIDI